MNRERPPLTTLFLQVVNLADLLVKKTIEAPDGKEYINFIIIEASRKNLYFMKPTRKEITPGTQVAIVQKHDQRTGILTKGIVADILTKSPAHPHGIKVRLETGEVGRVQEVMPFA
jgi:uncharacterized repeat protein (TIGR03833 family)